MRSPEPMPISFGQLLAAQFRATGFALTREAMMAGAALTLICVLILSMAWRENDQLFFQPELLLPTLGVAPLLPFALWKGDRPFGHAPLWTLPVRHQQAAIAKVLAGAAWLMVAMLVVCAAFSIVALLSGGGLGVTRTRLLAGDTGDVAAAVKVVWHMPGWMWLTPFVGVLTLYFASSAALLGLRHPIVTLGATVFAAFLLGTVIENFVADGPVRDAFQAVDRALWEGRFGIDFAINGGEDALSYHVRQPDGDYVRLWRAMPQFSGWAMAAFFWLGLSLAALALAIRRHWER